MADPDQGPVRRRVERQGLERRLAEFEPLADQPALVVGHRPQGAEAPGRLARHQHDAAGIGHHHGLAAGLGPFSPGGLDAVELDLDHHDPGLPAGARDPAAEIEARRPADGTEGELAARALGQRLLEVGPEGVHRPHEAAGSPALLAATARPSWRMT